MNHARVDGGLEAKVLEIVSGIFTISIFAIDIFAASIFTA